MPQQPFGCGTPGPKHSNGPAESSQSDVTVSAPAHYGDASQSGAEDSRQQVQQPGILCHRLGPEHEEAVSGQTGQQEGAFGQGSFLISNPTFESYLDSGSDDELQPVEGCTTPRTAIKQQASQLVSAKASRLM